MRGRSARTLAAIAVAATVLSAAGIGAAAADQPGAEHFDQQRPDAVVAARGSGGPHASGGNLVDHGGPVLPAANLYAIWWGPASGFPTDAQSGISSLLTGFGGSQYLQIAQQYMRGSALTTNFAKTWLDTSAPPTKASTSTITGEISKVLTANGATPDPNGIYLVFTSTFPNGGNYCAWHSAASINGVSFAQAYMPNTSGIAGCDPGNLYNANSYSEGTRSIANVLAHEMMEAITDKLPAGSTYAWIDSGGAEIGDKCAWQFGNKVLVGSTYWQLQEEWSNAVSGCVQQ